MTKKVGFILLRRRLLIFAILSSIIPFIIYILTLEPKLIGGDTSWYALQIPKMQLLVPTGYPTFSLLSKFFTYLPIRDLAYRLNLFSAVFGALTVLFLFLSINKLVKNEFVSLVSSLCFAFVYPFWCVANRLEFDTLNSFYIALVIFSALTFNETRKRKHLYFFFFCLGLSLTNHPIALFVVPAFFIYVIIIDPKIFKNPKTILLSILFFIIPLLSYLYLPIRSFQGYGSVTSFQAFWDYITGKPFRVTFGSRSAASVFEVFKDYIEIIYINYGVILVILSIAGLIYLFRKNAKFAIFSLLAVIFNFAIITQFLGWANLNYIIDTLFIMSIYIAFGLLLIVDMFKLVFKKSLMGKKLLKIDIVLKHFGTMIILLFFAFQPFSLAYANYNRADLSEPRDVYKFWDQAINNMEKGSVIYVYAFSSNVGMFVNKYEYAYKQIEFIYHNNPRYSVEDMIKTLEEGKPVYFVGNRRFLKSQFDTERVGKQYYWPWYKEFLELYRIKSPRVNLEIIYVIDGFTKRFGEKFTVEYIICNKNKKSIKIDSLELELPDNIEYVGVSKDGDIKQDPGLSRGIFMWVNDSYRVPGEGKMSLIVTLRGTRPGRSLIKFRITANEMYVNCDGLEMNIKD